MYLALLTDARWHASLRQLDQELAATVRAAGCPCCGGALHSARYPRKPRGLPPQWRPEQCRRLSFCCAAEECRKRTTPPSVYFLGRKVYLATAVVLVSALRCGLTPTRMELLKELVGVSRQTVRRWQTWWQQVLPKSPFWRACRGVFCSTVEIGELPQSLLEQFAGGVEERLLALLRFLAPLTGGRRSVATM